MMVVKLTAGTKEPWGPMSVRETEQKGNTRDSSQPESLSFFSGP